MSPRHRRYLLLDQGVGAGIVNLLLNAGIAWLVFRGTEAVPLWGQQSIAGDTIGTAFVLPFLSTLIASAVVRSQVRAGYVPAIALSARSALRRLPRSLAGRGAVLGLIGVVVTGLPMAAALDIAGVGQMAFGDFVAFKAVFAAVLGALVTPVIARAALADALVSEP
jgi:hypothetical protein